MLKAKINTNLKKEIKDQIVFQTKNAVNTSRSFYFVILEEWDEGGMAFGRDKLEGMSLPVITGGDTVWSISALRVGPGWIADSYGKHTVVSQPR